MAMRAHPFRLVRRVIMMASCAAALTACSTTGRTFDSSALALLTPGQTTLEQASELLGSDPITTYRQFNGAETARWAYKVSLATDAAYFRQELWLAFGQDGRFERVVNTINIPVSAKPVRAAQAPVILSSNAQSAPNPLTSSPANPLADASAVPIDRPAVTFPLN